MDILPAHLDGVGQVEDDKLFLITLALQSSLRMEPFRRTSLVWSDLLNPQVIRKSLQFGSTLDSSIFDMAAMTLLITLCQVSRQIRPMRWL